MKKIIFSLAIMLAAGAVVFGATTAYFSDTETSTGNTFTAGTLDLKIDSECHYNGMVCEKDSTGAYTWQGNSNVGYPVVGTPCTCTWVAKDLEGERLFDFGDVKPGDEGENTISIHVDGNDAYGRIKIIGIENRENGCTEPEGQIDGTCVGRWCGELAQNMNVHIWLDQGMNSGFQGKDKDSGEGDNIWQGEQYEPTISHHMVLGAGEAETACIAMVNNPQGDLPVSLVATTDPFLIKGGATHYYGVAWSVDFGVNNIIQSDSIKADIKFEIEQARHNDTPFQN